MDSRILIALAVFVALAIILGFILARRRRRQQLRTRFGPEYDRTLRQHGSARQADALLEQREKRVASLEIRPLPDSAQQRFSQHWWEIQRRFVDDPTGAIAAADSLVTDVMSARGYPMTDFEQQSADISVDHPLVVENYRSAHEIASRQKSGKTSTEELRKAMVHYRSLFEELLGGPERREVA